MLRRRLMENSNDVYENGFGFYYLKAGVGQYVRGQFNISFQLDDDVYYINGNKTGYKVEDIIKSVIFKINTYPYQVVVYDSETYSSTKKYVEKTITMESVYGPMFGVYIEWKLPISEILQFQNVVYINSSVYEDDSDDDITIHIIGDIRSLLYGENVKGKKIPSSVLYSDHGLLYENMLGQLFESMFYGSNGETFYSIDGHNGTSPERYLRHYMSVIPNGATKPRWQLYFGGGVN